MYSMFTSITELNSKKDYTGVIHMAQKSSLIMIIMLMPITIVTCFASQEIVTIVFGRGAFDQHAIQGASYALIGYGIGFIAFALKSLYARVLYSNKDTKKPMVNSSIGILINIVLSIILSRSMGVLGVTLASSISEYIAAGLNIRSARKVLPTVKSAITSKNIIIVVVATIICLILAFALMNIMSVQKNIVRFGIYTIVCLGAFYLCTFPIINRFILLKK